MTISLHRIQNKILAAFRFHLLDFINAKIIKKNIYYVIEDNSWSIYWDGRYITENLERKSCCITNIRWIKNSIIHFGSFNTLFSGDKINIPHHSNTVIVTVFHLKEKDPRRTFINKIDQFVNKWHTSSLMTKKELIQHGIHESKIIIIPLGVDLSIFSPQTELSKNTLRAKYNIPKDAFCIGSFQKDGEGSTYGNIPKLIKGPDIFCNVIKRLKKNKKIFVILTGPARGYVKNTLDQFNIPYLHIYEKNFKKIPKLYHLLDLYLITSRIEGGPKAILESMASGVPLVSTPVGMAPYIINNNVNGVLCNNYNDEKIAERVEQLITDQALYKNIKERAIKTVCDYTWQKVTKSYENELYG